MIWNRHRTKIVVSIVFIILLAMTVYVALQWGDNWIVVLWTIVLGIATVRLWLSTDDLVERAKTTAEHELRAYIGIKDMGTTFEYLRIRGIADPQPDGPLKIFTINYGKTPARGAEMWIRIENRCPEGAPD